MKNPVEIDYDTIVVATEDEQTTCGIKYIKKGSILKVARFKPEWRDTVKVFRNIDGEKENKWYPIELEKLRLATKEEEEMWNNEMYFIELTKTI